jgi:hypothetical protein
MTQATRVTCKPPHCPAPEGLYEEGGEEEEEEEEEEGSRCAE